MNPEPVYSNTNKEPVVSLLLLHTQSDWEYLISEEATLADAVGIGAGLNLNWRVWILPSFVVPPKSLLRLKD